MIFEEGPALIRPFVPEGPAFETLRSEAKDEGYRFIETLIRRWQDGSDRYSLEGEALLAAFIEGELVAVGGLNRDPYLKDGTGRIRHVYVRKAWRKSGVGKQLVATLVTMARRNFPVLRLRASDEAACKFYDEIGFDRFSEDTATHRMPL